VSLDAQTYMLLDLYCKRHQCAKAPLVCYLLREFISSDGDRLPPLELARAYARADRRRCEDERIEKADRLKRKAFG